MERLDCFIIAIHYITMCFSRYVICDMLLSLFGVLMSLCDVLLSLWDVLLSLCDVLLSLCGVQVHERFIALLSMLS